MMPTFFDGQEADSESDYPQAQVQGAVPASDSEEAQNFEDLAGNADIVLPDAPDNLRFQLDQDNRGGLGADVGFSEFPYSGASLLVPVPVSAYWPGQVPPQALHHHSGWQDTVTASDVLPVAQGPIGYPSAFAHSTSSSSSLQAHLDAALRDQEAEAQRLSVATHSNLPGGNTIVGATPQMLDQPQPVRCSVPFQVSKTIDLSITQNENWELPSSQAAVFYGETVSELSVYYG
jgi:hypothetical protein